ncbi:MAG: hypothetical protein HZA91_04945 [Verrucomicrobia bacterium]|nr:hypothetical protein [Verrucomicrobiota bacterium]
MKRIASSVLFVLGSVAAFAQGAGSAPAGSSAGPIIGWSLAAVGVIAILVVVARRLSTGQPWKLEVPVAIVGILLLNIGAWRLVANRIDELEKEKQGIQNQVTAAKRTVVEQQDFLNQARQQIMQWQARDQEWQKLKEDWTAYANNLKQRLDAITAARADRSRTPVTTTKSTKPAGGKTTTKKKP